MKDTLFLMKPGFVNAGLGPFYCSDSVSVEGLLGFFPELRNLIDVVYVEFPRPRAAIIDLIGEENQGVPVLVLEEGATVPGALKATTGRVYLNAEARIRAYLSERHKLPTAG